MLSIFIQENKQKRAMRIMFSRSDFAKKFILLRDVHNLSNSLLADLLQLKSRSSVNNLGNQENNPSVDLLTLISDLFGVSADWLIGSSDEIYNVGKLRSAEKEIYAFLNHPSIVNYPERQFFYGVGIHALQSHTFYFHDDNLSKMEEFCPAARANIIFALKVLLYASTKYYKDGHDANTTPFPSLLYTLFKTGKKTERALAELCFFCYFDILQYYWNPLPFLEHQYKNDIIFNLSKEPQSLQELDSKIKYFSKDQISLY